MEEVDGLVGGSLKRLSADNTSTNLQIQTDESGRGSVEVGMSKAMVVMEKPSGVPPLPPVYVSLRKEVKRSKKGDGNGRNLDNTAAGGYEAEVQGMIEGNSANNDASAGSPEECRRQQ